MRVLVTGSEGFVGRHLVPALGAAGHDVTGRDLDLDVTDPPALEEAFAAARPEAVIHLAAVSSVALSQSDQDLTFRVNYLGSRAVLQALSRTVPTARLLFVGSAEVYGVSAPEAPPFDETWPLRPRSPYARTKACADRLAADHARRGLDVVRVRPFNHAGPGQSAQFVLPSFAAQLAEIAAGRREPVLRVGNLDSVRDFLDVGDVVRAYLALLDPAVPAGVYNVASGHGRRVGDLLEGLRRRAGVDVRVETDPARYRPTDRGVGDADKLRRATDWAPQVPFEDTLDRVFSDAAQRSRGS